LKERPDVSSSNVRPVKMYATQTCPYCHRAKALLHERGVRQIDEVRVDLHPAERETMMRLTGRRTVPQIFIGATHVGGCDDLVALDQRGGLVPLLASVAASG
jgi:glutaredoxin 3